MTRKETKEWAKNVVDHIFHRHHKEEATIDCWLARDHNGFLGYYYSKPTKYDDWWDNDGCKDFFGELDSTLFPNVKWEDEEPTPVTITIKMK